MKLHGKLYPLLRHANGTGYEYYGDGSVLGYGTGTGYYGFGFGFGFGSGDGYGVCEDKTIVKHDNLQLTKEK